MVNKTNQGYYLLPMHSVDLVDRGSDTNMIKRMYLSVLFPLSLSLKFSLTKSLVLHAYICSSAGQKCDSSAFEVNEETDWMKLVVVLERERWGRRMMGWS